MIPKVADKRRDGKSSFVKLVTYVTIRDDVKMSETLSPDTPFVRQFRSNEANFANLIKYIDREASPDNESLIIEFPDGRQQIMSGDVRCETNCFSLQTAAAEMNAVAAQNRRTLDPVYHFILSWPVADNPQNSDIFDSARECLKQLGMADNQFVTAIHRDTDHVHCHVAVNRINPISYRAANLWNDIDTLHKTCRRLELKHNWLPTNGAWVVEDGAIVRPVREFKNAPNKARQLEYYSDRESLFSYAVENCREALNDVFNNHRFTWNMVHDVLITAGLELRQKGGGLAIFDNSDNPVAVPVKASHLHPALTLSALEPRIGPFQISPEPQQPAPGALVVGYHAERHYNPSLHARDRDARMERREQRAADRDNLIAEYKAYRSNWVRPVLLKEDIRSRFKSLSDDFRKRRETISLVNDPLLRKMLCHALAFDRMVATSALRLELKSEREALRRSPEAQIKSYRQWVEARALEHDRAAIAQLRGWAYRAKRSDRTPALSDRVLKCAVADDIRPFNISGYDTRVNRDGAIYYQKDGSPAIVDKGAHIEIVGTTKRDLVAAYCLAERKSGEVLEIRGRKAFLQEAVAALPDYHKVSGKPLPLSHPTQRQWAGYEKKQIQPEEVAPKNSAQHTPGYKPG